MLCFRLVKKKKKMCETFLVVPEGSIIFNFAAEMFSHFPSMHYYIIEVMCVCVCV